MNRTKLKNYAPQARRDFIQAMTDRAAFYGLTAKKIEPVVEKGDVGGDRWAGSILVPSPRSGSNSKTASSGMASSRLWKLWPTHGSTDLFAIRFMEVHGYLDHGYRVLSHSEGKPTPENPRTRRACRTAGSEERDDH